MALPEPINPTKNKSVQGRARRSRNGVAITPNEPIITTVNLLTQVADEIPEWSIYPHRRDFELRRLYKKETIISGAVYSLSARMKALSYTPFEVDTPAGQIAQDIWERADFGNGGDELVAKTVIDLLTQDNGAFWELEGFGSPEGKRVGPPTAVNYLDPAQCYRTFDPEYPVLYLNPFDHTIHKLHYTRVVMMANMQQPNELARGVGFCAVSRAMLNMQLIRDIQTFRHEKVAGRFKRALGYGKGITDKSFKKAIESVEAEDEAQGFTRYSRIPFLTSVDGIELNLLNLAAIPDGFNLVDELNLYVYAVALAFGVDAREFWPATASGATKADASVQNMKARGKGIADLIMTIESAWSQVLPPDAQLHYDFVDDEQDLQRTEIHERTVNLYSKMVFDGNLDRETFLEIMAREGVLEEDDVTNTLKRLAKEEAEKQAFAEQQFQNKPPDDNAPPPDNTDTPDNTNPEMGTAATKAGDNTYGAAIRANIRSLYEGYMTPMDFFNAMEGAVIRGFTRAYLDGAAACGIQGVNELTPDERTKLDRMIQAERWYIPNLANYILDAKAAGQNVNDLLPRADLWQNTYLQVVNYATLNACKDKKLEWTVGATKNPCWHSINYRGRVYRASTWNKYLDPYDTHPRGRGLECQGYNCQCDLAPTDKAVTPGFPPVWSGSKALFLILDEPVTHQGMVLPKGMPLYLDAVPSNAYEMILSGKAHLRFARVDDLGVVEWL